MNWNVIKKIIAWCILAPLIFGILFIFIVGWKYVLGIGAFFAIIALIGWAIGEVGGE